MPLAIRSAKHFEVLDRLKTTETPQETRTPITPRAAPPGGGTFSNGKGLYPSESSEPNQPVVSQHLWDELFHEFDLFYSRIEAYSALRAEALLSQLPNAASNTAEAPSNDLEESPQAVDQHGLDKDVKALVRQALRSLLSRNKGLCLVGPPEPLLQPTEQQFYFIWSEATNSEWNRAAFDVLADFLYKAYPSRFKIDDRSRLIAHAKTHFRWLRERYISDTPPETWQAEKKRQQEYSRKRGQLKRRVETVLTYWNQLGHHLPLLERLGTDGMSSDEEDDTPDKRGKKVYRVRRKAYLSMDTSQLMQKLDWVYNTRIRQNRPHGRSPHTRIPGRSESSNPRHIPGLPSNCYNPQWLAKLSLAELEKISPLNSFHNFNFPQDLLAD